MERLKVAHLRVFVGHVEVETGQHVRILRSDSGGEYTRGDLALSFHRISQHHI